jgi:hypothetical protein
VTKTKPFDPLPVFQAISVLAESSRTLTVSGVAVILGVPPTLMPPLPSCVALPASHGDAKQTTSPIPSAENTAQRFATTQGLTVANNNEELLVILSIMRRTLGFPSATPLVTFQRAI